jgi:ankyrin repeat protein
MKSMNQNLVRAVVAFSSRIFATAIVMFGIMSAQAAPSPFVTVAPVENAYNHSPLCAAIAKGDVDAVRKFIEYGVDVNEISNDYTPLMLAARYNRADIIELLLKAGADAKYRNGRGMTAIKIAQQFNAEDAVRVLQG